MHDYDCLFCNNLFSFRQHIGVKKAIYHVVNTVNTGNVYTYKVDIHDYFNSVNTEKVLNIFEREVSAEPSLYRFLTELLKNPYAIKNGEKISVRKGIMAGMPVSGFLANMYLMDLDKWFNKQGMTYLRYSDDIIVFSEDDEIIKASKDYIYKFLEEKGLSVNHSKEFETIPGESIEFLGFQIKKKAITISQMAKKKIKDKLKRKAKAIYRWRIRKNVSGEKAAKAYIKYLNNKFYNNPIHGEITWCRWYFPVISKDDCLKDIDEYTIACIRYIFTGRYSKKNYDIKYEKIKQIGFRSLVNSYWKFKSGRYFQE